MIIKAQTTNFSLLPFSREGSGFQEFQENGYTNIGYIRHQISLLKGLIESVITIQNFIFISIFFCILALSETDEQGKNMHSLTSVQGEIPQPLPTKYKLKLLPLHCKYFKRTRGRLCLIKAWFFFTFFQMPQMAKCHLLFKLYCSVLTSQNN